MQVEDLSVAVDLESYGLLGLVQAEFLDYGLYGLSGDRRRGEKAHVPYLEKRHVERPGNRSRGKRETVDVGLQFLDAVLVLDAEALLLVDDQKAQVPEDHVLLDYLVRSEKNVQVSVHERGKHPLLLLRGHHSAKKTRLQREVVEP